jgi:hypothetical protein
MLYYRVYFILLTSVQRFTIDTLRLQVRGIRRHGRTILPSAVRLLPRKHQLRRDYEKEFSKDPVLTSYGNLGRPAKRNREESVASATRVLRRPTKAVKKEEAFLTISTFTSRLNYHDVTKHCMIDNAHTLGNMVKLILGNVTNVGKAKGASKFAKANRDIEIGELERFPYLLRPVPGSKKRFATFGFYLLNSITIIER